MRKTIGDRNFCLGAVYTLIVRINDMELNPLLWILKNEMCYTNICLNFSINNGMSK